MITFVKRSCPICNYVFDNWNINYMSIGCPITICPKCKLALKNDHINEWCLTPFLRKIHFFFSYFYTSLAYSFWIIIIIYFFSSAFGYEEYFFNQNKPTIVSFIVLSVVGFTFLIIFLYRISLFIKDIKKSNERMQDIKYLNYLIKYGVIDPLDKLANCKFCNNEILLTQDERILHKFICPQCKKINLIKIRKRQKRQFY